MLQFTVEVDSAPQAGALAENVYRLYCMGPCFNGVGCRSRSQWHALMSMELAAGSGTPAEAAARVMHSSSSGGLGCQAAVSSQVQSSQNTIAFAVYIALQ